MPYKIPNTFNAKTPLGQSVQNLMTSYFGNLPTPADIAKADYMNSTAEASKARAALNRQKYDANAGAQTVYENIINNPEGLDPQEAMVKNLAAYMANQQQSGNIGNAGKSILAIAPWMRGNTPETVNKAQLGSGMATNNTLEGTLQHENFQNQRANIAQAGQDRRAASTPLRSGGKGVLPHQALKMQNELTREISESKNTLEDIQPFIDSLDRGELQLGPIDNSLNYLRNQTDNSTKASQSKALFDTWKEDLRNRKLLLNKGTQTEGDALRAIDAIISAGKDTKLLRANLVNLQLAFKRMEEQSRLNLNNVTSNYGLPDMDVSEYDQGTAVDLDGKTPSPAQDNDWLSQLTNTGAPQQPSGGSGIKITRIK